MSSIKEKGQGVYNPAQRYNVTNILDEDFTTYWNKLPVTIAKGKTISVPEYLADKMVDEMVDKIMLAQVKANEEAYYKANPNTAPNNYRAPNSMGVPAARKVWEDKIVEKLPMEEGSTEAQLLRLQIKEQLETDLKAEASTDPVAVPQSAVGNFSQESLKEFAEIKSGNEPVKKKK